MIAIILILAFIVIYIQPCVRRMNNLEKQIFEDAMNKIDRSKLESF